MIDIFYFKQYVRSVVKKNTSCSLSPIKIRINGLKRCGEGTNDVIVNEVSVDGKGRVYFSNDVNYFIADEICKNDLDKLMVAIDKIK